MPQTSFDAFSEIPSPGMKLNTSLSGMDQVVGSAMGVAVIGYSNEPNNKRSGNVSSLSLRQHHMKILEHHQAQGVGDAYHLPCPAVGPT